MRRPAIVAIVFLAAIALAIAGTVYFRRLHPYIDKSRVYRVGTDNALPYHAIDEQNGPIGFTADVLQEAARRAGIQLHWVLAPDGGLKGIQSGAVDLWAALSPASAAGNSGIYFTEPWLRSEHVMVSRDLGPVVEPRHARIVALWPFPITTAIATSLFPQAQYLRTATREDAWNAVCTFQADAAIVEVRFAQYYSVNRPFLCANTDLRLVGLDSPQVDLAIAARPEVAAVADALRREIYHMAAAGEIRRVLRFWAYMRANDIQTIYREDLASRNNQLAWAVAVLIAFTTLGLAIQGRHSRALAVAAQTAEHQLSETLANIQELVWRYSVPLRSNIYLSPVYERIFGYKPEDLRQDPDLSIRITHPDDRQRLAAVIEKAVQGQPMEIEHRILRPDGSIRWIYARLFPVRDANGTVVELSGFTRDVTDRIQAEFALRESERRFRTLIERSQDILFILDSALIVTFVSPSLREVTGFLPEEVTGASATLLAAPSDLDRVLEEVGPILKTPGSSGTFECRLHHKDGSELTVEGTIQNFTHDPVIHGFVVHCRDITHRKQIELHQEALITELEAKNAELERFTYTVSHDLKGPLITIRGYLGFVQEAIDASDVQSARNDLARIHKASLKLQQMLEDLLQLSRVGRMLHPKQDVLFSEIASEVVELLSGDIQKSGAKVEISPSLPSVFVDRVRAIEAVQNLVENAIKFTSSVSQPEIAITFRRQGSETVFLVRDNGIGIDPRYQDRIFGLFDKLDPKTEGSGIGLAIAKRIIEFHGGRIWVESEGPGKGAAFCFTMAPPPPL